MDATTIHNEAIERHKHYARHAKPLPSKLERAKADGSYRRYKVVEQEPVKDEHIAICVRRSLVGKFL